MKLLDILRDVKILKSSANLEAEVDCIASDHRKVKENSIFVAIQGRKRDGNDYIETAIQNGAKVIITDKKQKISRKTQIIIVDNARYALSKMWSNYYHNPSEDIKTVAITGTNGKTSSAYFLYGILRNAGISCGLISTVEYLINDKKIDVTGRESVVDIPSSMTTPDPEILYYIFNEMKKSNVKIAVIEASSHALEQGRLDGIDIEIGCFTNLSSEHMDYHNSMENYKKSKEKLMKKSKLCIINTDDDFGKALKEKYRGISFGISAKRKEDFFADNIIVNSNGCQYDLNFENKKIKISTKIIGAYTVYNSILASVCAIVLKIDDKNIVDGIKNTVSIKGRLEKYYDKSIYIDYAHTPDSMEKVITSIKEIEKGKRLITLFGCGGDRDKSKRAKMGKIATFLSDLTVITSDNSRSEKLSGILSDIIKGISENKEFIVIPNRKTAIQFIAKKLKENEVLLLLGKGHEEYEINADGKNYFSERKILDEVFSGDR